MSTQKPAFQPEWFEGNLDERSWRSIFKWGAASVYKHPNKRLYRLMRDEFGLDDSWFATKHAMGLEPIDIDLPCRLSDEQVQALSAIVGPENSHTQTIERLRVAYGKTMGDLMRLRHHIVENVPDIVLWPQNRAHLRSIVDYCEHNDIAVYVYGGGSSVTRGFEAVRGGVMLDMRRHLNKMLDFNEEDMTITVEAGMDGPTLERLVNNAARTLQARRNYTVGHFPQSFEYSVVGGWVVTRGAGQNSTYYGKIEDMVLAQDYVCPGQRDLVTRAYPRKATGPDVDQIMMGSEGCYGILYSATIKLHPYLPKARRRYSYIFPDWEAAKAATREVMQGEFGFPSVFRLSDAEETDIALTLYGVGGTIFDTFLSMAGYKPGRRCLLLGTVDGDPSYTALVRWKIRKICRRHRAMWTSGYVAEAWEHGRFTDPYLREDLQDHGIMIDTLECATTWSHLQQVYDTVRNFIHSRPATICMTHMSHFYPQGCNLYFIFIAKMDSLAEYKTFQRGILAHIEQSGAALSHHHGIGKSFAPFLASHVGAASFELFKALKTHFDPHGILNPGGTLALDGVLDEQANAQQ
jgi:alkyldihydroxyacetonephosphate synthase